MIGLAFVIPLLIMLLFLWKAAKGQIDSTRSEREGISYLRPLAELILQAQERRHAVMDEATDIVEIQKRVRTAFKLVRIRQAALGGMFQTEKTFEKSRHHGRLRKHSCGFRTFAWNFLSVTRNDSGN